MTIVNPQTALYFRPVLTGRLRETLRFYRVFETPDVLIKSFNIELYEFRKGVDLAVKDKTGKNIEPHRIPGVVAHGRSRGTWQTGSFNPLLAGSACERCRRFSGALIQYRGFLSCCGLTIHVSVIIPQSNTADSSGAFCFPAGILNATQARPAPITIVV